MDFRDFDSKLDSWRGPSQLEKSYSKGGGISKVIVTYLLYLGTPHLRKIQMLAKLDVAKPTACYKFG